MRLRILIDKEVAIEYKTSVAPEDFKDFMFEFLEWQSGLIVERINTVVKRQLYSWSPLSDSYKKWKEKMGLSPDIWIASGYVLKAIHYYYNPMSDSFFIGVHPTLRHREYLKGGKLGTKTGARVLDIIRWLEFGTRKMPPRPLFTKVFSEFRPKKRQLELYQQFIRERKGL